MKNKKNRKLKKFSKNINQEVLLRKKRKMKIRNMKMIRNKKIKKANPFGNAKPIEKEALKPV